MTQRPKYCPICYSDITKNELTDDQKFVKCKKCNILIHADKSNNDIIRCSVCSRVFANTMSYNDHLLSCEISKRLPSIVLSNFIGGVKIG